MEEEEGKMKKGLIAIVLALVLCLVVPLAEAKPSEITVPMNQAQFQCRLWDPPGWRYWYVNYPISWDFRVAGNVLHTEISYQPDVSEEEGTSMVYVYDKEEDCWILHEGTIGYVSPYSGLWITEYWKGYLKFDENMDFEHGVGYQWGYVFGEDEATVKDVYVWATWDETMGGWFLGFSIYLWDSESQEYTTATIPFPGIIEPVPKSDYNPLDY